MPTGLKAINHFLGLGKSLPVPRQVQDLASTRLFTYYKFLMIESDPRIERTVRDKVFELTDELQKELID